MLIRHRGDLVNNIKENLVNKDNITLDDVKKTLSREINNRLELFNYVGKGIWGKLSSWSRNAMDWYKNTCNENGHKFYCFGDSTKSRASDGLEREYAR